MVALAALHASYQTPLLIRPQGAAHDADVLRQDELVLRRAQDESVLDARLLVVLPVGDWPLEADARDAEDASHLRLGAALPTEVGETLALHEAHLAGDALAYPLGAAGGAHAAQAEPLLRDLTGAVGLALTQAHVADGVHRVGAVELGIFIVGGLLGRRHAFARIVETCDGKSLLFGLDTHIGFSTMYV